MELGVKAVSGRLNAIELDVLLLEEVSEDADGVGAAADACENRVRKTSVLLLHELPLGLLADNLLELLHYGRERMRTCRGAEHVMGVLEAACPVAERLVAGLLQCADSGGYRNDLSPHEPHSEDIGLLTLDVGDAHVDPALESEKRADNCCCNAVLSGAGLGDDSGLAHSPCKEGLTEYLVGLVGAAVEKILSLEVDPGVGALGDIPAEGNRSGTACVIVHQVIELGPECGVILCLDEGLLKLEQGRNEDFSHVHSAVLPEERIQQCFHT